MEEGFPGFAFGAETGKVTMSVGECSALVDGEVGIYRAICCSRSWILASFEVFFGLGFGNEGGGVDSFCPPVSPVVLFNIDHDMIGLPC